MQIDKLLYYVFNQIKSMHKKNTTYYETNTNLKINK